MRIGRQEIEIKLRVANLSAVRRRLRRYRAQRLRRVHEMNTLFDTARSTLRKRGQLLRLRIETPAGSRGSGKAILTLKGGSQRSGRYKVRAEAEMPIARPEVFTEILAAAGLRPTFRYEKIRSSYRVPSAPGLHVELDETPIGVFVELEGSRQAIDRMARRLGYGPKDYITKSYAALYVEDCRRKAVGARDLLFRGQET